MQEANETEAQNETESAGAEESSPAKSSNLVSVTNSGKLIRFRDLDVTLPHGQTVEITKEQAKIIKKKPLYKHISKLLKFD